MNGFSLLDFFAGPAAQRQSLQGAMAKPYTTVYPTPASPLEDQMRNDAGNPPYRTADTLDNFGGETNSMREAYLRFYRVEPTAKAAIRGKVNAIKCLDVTLQPNDKSKPNDVAAAKFCDWAIRRTPHGWDGLIGNVLSGAFIQGFSVNEIVLTGLGQEDSDQYAGFWGLKHCKPKNINFVSLQMDAYRNVTGILNNVQGLATYPRRKFILFTHDELFDDPTGGSDLRAAYRACQLIDEAIKLWYYAEKVFGGPVVVGKYAEKSRRKQMEEALDRFRQGGWMSMSKDDEVELLNLASSIGSDGKSKLIDKMREEVFLAVRGAFSPFMPGGDGAERGNTQTNKSTTSDPDEEAIAKALGRKFSHDMLPALVTHNFPRGTGVPHAVLGGVNWFETKTQLEVVQMLEGMNRPVDDEYVYNLTKMPPGKPKPQPGMPGGAGGTPAPLGPLVPEATAGGAAGDGSGTGTDGQTTTPVPNEPAAPPAVPPEQAPGPLTFAAVTDDDFGDYLDRLTAPNPHAELVAAIGRQTEAVAALAGRPVQVSVQPTPVTVNVPPAQVKVQGAKVFHPRQAKPAAPVVNVTVQPTPVHVQAAASPTVTNIVQPTPVSVTTPPAMVTVQPTPVNVTNVVQPAPVTVQPLVTVQPTPVVVNNLPAPPRVTDIVVERDENGRIRGGRQIDRS